jgi:hypothetical protein
MEVKKNEPGVIDTHIGKNVSRKSYEIRCIENKW